MRKKGGGGEEVVSVPVFGRIHRSGSRKDVELSTEIRSDNILRRVSNEVANIIDWGKCSFA